MAVRNGNSLTFNEEDNDESPVFIDTKNSIDLLSKNFLICFEEDLKVIQVKVQQIQQHQSVLNESVNEEKNRLSKCGIINEIEAAMLQVDKYRMKLCQIKKMMHNLKESSLRLRKEALRLQQIKQRDNMKREDQRHKYLAEEHSLIAQIKSS